jgi:hypothetical protein
MRFMMLIKADRDTEAGKLPDEKILTAMGQYNEELVRAGVLLAGEGLHPSARGFRVKKSGGQITVKDGPFTEAKELVAGFWILQVKSKEEAIEWAKRVPLEAGQIELRQVFELSDFPVAEHESGWREQESDLRTELESAPPPAGDGTRIRYMLFMMANERSEAGELPDQKVLTDMGNVIADIAKTGALLAGEGLQPSAKGARITFAKGKRTVTDGPFSEAKELIAGYTMVQVGSPEEAIEWARRELLVDSSDGEIQIRRVFEASDFGPELQAKVPEVFAREKELRERVHRV